MLKNLFHRRENAPAVMQSPDTGTNSRSQSAPAVEYAGLGSNVSAPRTLSPVVRAAAERITGQPIA